MLTYFLALLAACANATASVLQRKANRDQPSEENLSWRLIRDLLHRPVWFAGIVAVIIGFLLQAAALGGGQLAVVEPILVLELPAALVLAAFLFHGGLHAREWGAAVVMTTGLVGLLYFLSPSAGTSVSINWYVWLIGIAASLGVVALLVAVARIDAEGPRRAALLGAATGSGFGLTAALMKGMTNQFAHGFAALFTSWQLYGMIAAGALSMFLLQSAMNAGPLIAAQPAITLSDPIVSILWGVLVFGEHTRGGLYLVLAVISGAVLTAAVLALARSPLLHDESADDDARAGESAETPEHAF